MEIKLGVRVKFDKESKELIVLKKKMISLDDIA